MYNKLGIYKTFKNNNVSYILHLTKWRIIINK